MGSKGEPYFPIGSEIQDPVQETRYILKKLIGRGAYAQCYLAMVGNEPFALKIVKYSELRSEKVKQKLHSEISIHSILDHPNVVRMYTHFKIGDHICLVLELCERGALDDLLRRNGKLKERYASKFVQQLVRGLLYLHEEKSVVHRDLKLGNLFLDGHLNIKIGDFGLSAVISGNEKRRTVCGTPNYIAPEILFGKATGHSFEADVWSLGVIIYTLLIGTPPFQQKKVEEIYKLIGRNQYIFPPDNTLSSEAIDLITRLLTTNPDERPDLHQILQHRFLSQRENLAYRVYKNIFTGNYTINPVETEHVIFSMPMASVFGIGYVLKSGICGIYYYDLKNVYIRRNSLIYVQLKSEQDKKVFITEEHLLEKLPECLLPLYNNILYFIKNYTSMDPTAIQSAKENPQNDRTRTVTTSSSVFVAKVKRIKDGLLFIMTNNVFVFDFNYGSKVVVAEDGAQIYAFDDDGPIKFTDALKEACTGVLKMYCGSR